VRVTEHRHRVPREVVASLSLELLRICLDMVLDNWLWVALLEHLGPADLQSSLPTSAIL